MPFLPASSPAPHAAPIRLLQRPDDASEHNKGQHGHDSGAHAIDPCSRLQQLRRPRFNDLQRDQLRADPRKEHAKHLLHLLEVRREVHDP